jgi:hydrogenase expression/formation protein HypC
MKELPQVPTKRRSAPAAAPEIDLDVYEAVACSLDQDGCLTCGDVAVPVTVTHAGELDAVCVDVYGHEGRVAIELVGPVVAGDRLLVHAGVAIEKLEAP